MILSQERGGEYDELDQCWSALNTREEEGGMGGEEGRGTTGGK